MPGRGIEQSLGGIQTKTGDTPVKPGISPVMYGIGDRDDEKLYLSTPRRRLRSS